jgi:outer membrane protein assembly factor BamB
MAGLPSVADGVVYFGVQNDASRGSVYALDASTGAVQWRFTTPLPTAGEFPAAPAVEQGVVYVAFAHTVAFENPTSSIYALDATTGAGRCAGSCTIARMRTPRLRWRRE